MFEHWRIMFGCFHPLLKNALVKIHFRARSKFSYDWFLENIETVFISILMKFMKNKFINNIFQMFSCCIRKFDCFRKQLNEGNSCDREFSWVEILLHGIASVYGYLAWNLPIKRIVKEYFPTMNHKNQLSNRMQHYCRHSKAERERAQDEKVTEVEDV